ncbi:MAG: lipoprotein-releasing ABC transporter permease subunit [Steroidobacteraceae bacterium]
MFQPLPLFVGLRYVRSRQHRFFVSFITWVSLAGVSLGVAALIVILSVMNGFEGELRERLLSLDAHARLLSQGEPDPVADERLRRKLAVLPGVKGAAPYMELTALAVHQPEMLAVTLRGIDPQLEPAVGDVRPMVKEGSYAALQAGANAVLVGNDLAQQLGVGAGDRISLLVPVVGADGSPAPRLREFTVGGIFEAGLSDHDASLVLADLDDVRSFVPEARGVGGLRLRFDDALAAPQYMGAVRAAAAGAYEIHDWTQDHASYFRAIRIEKTMMALILLLIVAVAAFNIVAMLVMVVNDKRTDIAILRTYGAVPREIMGAFVTQGLVIGWLGVIAGVLLGVLIAANVEAIVPALEKVFRFSFLDADVYYDTRIPSVLVIRDVLWIGAIALALTLLATLYPAWRAARTSPADALRYE